MSTGNILDCCSGCSLCYHAKNEVLIEEIKEQTIPLLQWKHGLICWSADELLVGGLSLKIQSVHLSIYLFLKCSACSPDLYRFGGVSCGHQLFFGQRSLLCRNNNRVKEKEYHQITITIIEIIFIICIIFILVVFYYNLLLTEFLFSTWENVTFGLMRCWLCSVQHMQVHVFGTHWDVHLEILLDTMTYWDALTERSVRKCSHLLFTTAHVWSDTDIELNQTGNTLWNKNSNNKNNNKKWTGNLPPGATCLNQPMCTSAEHREITRSNDFVLFLF